MTKAIKQHSFGIIPIRNNRGTREFLLVRHRAGHWGFPKGHAESGETPLQTAERELSEETGLKIFRLLSPDSIVETYCFTVDGKLTIKTVDYFVAIVEGKLLLQQAEISDARWVSIDEIADTITFPQTKLLCDRAIALIS